MYPKILSALRTHTFRQSIITVTSTFLAAGLGAVFYLLLARLIGAHEYGLFSISITIVTLLVTVADVGMGQGIIRFVAQNKNDTGYFPYANLAFRTKLVISASLWSILWVFAKPLAHLIRQPEVAHLLPLVGFGVFSQLLISFNSALFQALEKFFLWGGLQVGANLFRLVFLGLLVMFTPLSAYWGIILFSLAAFSGFLVSWIWVDKRILVSQIQAHQSREFWHFNKWTAAFVITSSIVSRADTLLTARFLTLSQTGVYALAATMVAFLPQLSGAIGAVTAPKFAGFSKNTDSQVYLRKATLFSIGTSVLVAAVMIPVAMFVVRFTGRDFTGAITPFLVLLGSLSIFTFLNPVRDSILYFYHRPHFFFWVSLVQGLVLLVSGLILIPAWGVLGTATSVLISHFVLAVLCVCYYFKISR